MPTTTAAEPPKATLWNSALSGLSWVKPEWRDEFSQRIHALTAERGKTVAWFVLLTQVPAFLLFDTTMYYLGYWDTTPVFALVLAWRVALTIVFGGLLASYYLPSLQRLDSLRRIQATSAITLLIFVGGVAFSVVCQLLAPDLSIYSLGVFACAALFPMPSRWKLAVYPAALVVVLAGMRMVGVDPLVWNGTLINAIGVTAFAMFIDQMCLQYVVRSFVAEREIGEERARSDALLRNVLPESIAERLRHNRSHIVEHHTEVTVLFADLVGFTTLTTRVTPSDLIAVLERMFDEFDALAERHGVEKIKTVGDAYMAACGAPLATEDHAERIASMALDMLTLTDRLAREVELPLTLRIGIHTGPAIAGVIGTKKFAYDLWGDTVNTASRLESHGEAGKIQVSEQVHHRLRKKYRIERRGEIQLKGKGPMETYFLTGTV